MRVLVLGGNGFLGTHVVDALLQAGHKVVSFDLRPESSRSARPNVEYIIGNFAESDAILGALDGVDAVFHLVSTTVPRSAQLNPVADVEDNLIATLRLLLLLRPTPVKRFVYFSSGGTVYGIATQVPTPETHPLRPVNAYGIVKMAVERYIEIEQREHGLEPTILRISNPFGPRQGHLGVQGVISTLLNRLLRGEEIQIWGEGTIVRDYVYVDDVAKAAAKVIEKSAIGVFNIGSGVGRSIQEILGLMTVATGISPKLRYLQAQSFDVPISILDVSLAKRTFGWSPRFALEEALDLYWNWLQQRKNLGSTFP